MRQYYDVFCLLGNESIISFIGTTEYLDHKSKRIKGKDNEIRVSEHPALQLEDPAVRKSFEIKYKATSKLYYKGQPPFDEIIERINYFLPTL